VRNRRDGSVEALIHGPAETVAALVGWAQRGPAAARVDTVISTEHDAAEVEPLSSFEQRTTL
jgi:acylphosphatase